MLDGDYRRATNTQPAGSSLQIHDPIPLSQANSRKSSSGSEGGKEQGSISLLDDPRIVNFTCGLVAGLFAKLASHPLDVAKKRYQVAGLQRSLR